MATFATLQPLPLQLPRGVPFRSRDLLDSGVSSRHLYALERQGSVRRMLRGVLVTTDVADSLDLRIAALQLVVPPGGVVTDHAAAWLHGVTILPRRGPQDPLPPVSCFSRTHSTIRRAGVASGTRTLTPRDVARYGELVVTTPLRTACDLGRLRHRLDALAALDAYAAFGISARAVEFETVRFKGMRGVRQLRALTQLMDPAAESPGESALRLHWIEAGLPPPVVQHWVADQGRGVFRLDLADPRVRYAAEYDGEAFHAAEHEQHDRDRRAWLAARGWTIDVFRRADVYGKQGAPEQLQRGHRQAVDRLRGIAS